MNTDITYLTRTQRRLLLVACAEPKTTHDLADAANADDYGPHWRKAATELCDHGLMRLQVSAGGVLRYAITPVGEQAADAVFAETQAVRP